MKVPANLLSRAGLAVVLVAVLVAASWLAPLDSALRMARLTGLAGSCACDRRCPRQLLRSSREASGVGDPDRGKEGALRGILPDLFVSARRALWEVRALSRLAPLGLAPRPLVLEARGHVLLRLRIAVEEVPRSRNILELARDQAERLDTRLGRCIGDAVRAMHDAGVAHPDLSVGNILVVDGPSPSVRLIDFDGATVGDSPVSPEERVREILRLARSLDKWASTAATSGATRAAFLRAALPIGQRLSVFREACRRSEKLGRSPR